jgi:hypothetical protein
MVYEGRGIVGFKVWLGRWAPARIWVRNAWRGRTFVLRFPADPSTLGPVGLSRGDPSGRRGDPDSGQEEREMHG